MVIESIAGISGFLNYGGSVAWVINVDQDNVTLYTDYLRAYGSADNEVKWVNDSNGVPRLIAARLY